MTVAPADGCGWAGPKSGAHSACDILAALAAHEGNISRTAEALGLERSNLYKKMRALAIAPSRAQDESGLA